jgi:hypothetical protein
MRRTLAAFAASLALSACAGTFEERITPGDFFTAYRPSQFSAFAASGPIVEIHGARPAGATDAEIAEALRLPSWFAQTPFRVAPAGAGPEGRQRIILNFGSAGGMDPIAACAGRVNAGGVTDRLAVAAAFCRGTAPGSASRLLHERALAPGDPDFSRAMTRLFAEMFPPYDPLDRGRGRRMLFLAN